MASSAPPAKPLHVQPYDSVGRFLVTSEKDLCTRYCVDILSFDGEGECDCEHWKHRIGPHHKAEPRTTPPVRFCKHIEAARTFFADQVIQRMIETQKGSSNG